MSTDEYVPDKGSVEMHYVTGAVAANPGLTQIQARAEFDRFLARVRRDAAHEALDGLLAHAEERCGLSKSHRARDDWNTVAGATQDYRDTHYPEGDDQ